MTYEKFMQMIFENAELHAVSSTDLYESVMELIKSPIFLEIIFDEKELDCFLNCCCKLADTRAITGAKATKAIEYVFHYYSAKCNKDIYETLKEVDKCCLFPDPSKSDEAAERFRIIGKATCLFSDWGGD